MNKPDLYQAVTDRIVAALEAGAPPWVCPWTQYPDQAAPANLGSGRAYRGINVLLLNLQASLHGYALNRWLTYRQAQELGAQVRGGESGTPIVFFKMLEVDDERASSGPDRKVIPLLRSFRRFNGLPFLATEAGVFVEVAVTVAGVTLSQIHPVLDGRNRPLLAPNAFDINTSLQRCLVKAIALHGLGLYIYAGEDLPVTTDGQAANDEPPVRQERQERSDRSRQPSERDDFVPTISRSQQAQVHRLVMEVGVDLQHLLDYFGIESLAQITQEQLPRVIRSLEKRRARAA